MHMKTMKIITTATGWLLLLVTRLLLGCGPDDGLGGDGHDHDGRTAEPTRIVGAEEIIFGDAAVADGHNGDGDDHDDYGDHGDEEAGIHLSREQMQAVGVGFGMPREIQLNDVVRTTGTLDLPPNAYEAVTAPSAGFIRESRKVVEGELLRRGTRVAYLENPEFIEHQRAYLEAAAELTFLRQELQRQEELLAAEAGVLKDVQRLRSEVAAKAANVEGLSRRLAYIGIATDGLTPAGITSRVPLTLARSGVVTEVSLRDGMYVTPETALLELIDPEHFHIELTVFERDLGLVEVGQRLTYQVPSLGDEVYEAEVQVIGRSFDADNKTVLVHAHPIGEEPAFTRGLFVEARIGLSDERAEALPEEAVFDDGELSYVFVGRDDPGAAEVEFERVRVRAGATEGGYTAVTFIDEVPAGMRVVTEGAYFVYGQSQAGALEHDH